jgi:FAD/FMN-containing dehydrogenase
VRIGPGSTRGLDDRELYPHRHANCSCDSWDVGVGGLATTGGLGLLGRKHGLTIDGLVAAEVVTADGTSHRVSADEEPELFWAIRGAGANFGIVTAFEFDAAPTPNVVHASLGFVPRDLPGFLERWGQTVEQAPREISAFLYLGASFAQATIVYAGDDADAAAAALEPFTTLPGLAGGQAQRVPYATVPLTTGAPHTGQLSARARSGLALHLDRETSRQVALLANVVDMVQIRSAGGAINDVPPDATAYAHRHQNFSVTAVSRAGRAEFDAAWEPVHRRMDGMYLSFESDHRLSSLSEAFPEPTLARLRALKARWDPGHIFTQNFDLTATASDA